MQRSLIRSVLNPLSGLTEKLSDKARDRLFLFAGLGIFLYFFLYNMKVIRWRYLYSFVLCCGFLGIMILSGLRRGIQPVRFRRVMAVCWFGVGFLMLQSGIRNNTNYLPEAMLFLAAYPVLYICWGNLEPGRIFRLLLKLCRISGVIFLVASILFAQITIKRYGGIIQNVNNCANYLSLVCVCLAVELAYETKFNLRCLCNILLFGACEAIITYTNSRSGQLSMLCALAAGGVMFLLTHNLRENLRLVFRGLCCLLAAIVMTSCLLYVLQLRQRLPLPYFDDITRQFYFTEYWQERFEQMQATEPPETTQPTEGTTQPTEGTTQPTEGTTQPTEGTTQPTEDTTQPTVPEGTTASTQPTFFGHESFNELNNKKNDTTGKTADQFSTGRISVWKAYLQKLTLFGVAEKEPVYIKILYRNINTTHMTMLEIAYESGIFAGILYLLLNLSSGILAIGYAWKHRKEQYALMPLMVIITFGVDSVLRTTNISFNYMTTFYYYLILFPLMVHRPTLPESVAERKEST